MGFDYQDDPVGDAYLTKEYNKPTQNGASNGASNVVYSSANGHVTANELSRSPVHSSSSSPSHPSARSPRYTPPLLSSPKSSSPKGSPLKTAYQPPPISSSQREMESEATKRRESQHRLSLYVKEDAERIKREEEGGDEESEEEAVQKRVLDYLERAERESEKRHVSFISKEFLFYPFHPLFPLYFSLTYKTSYSLISTWTCPHRLSSDNSY